MLGSVPDTKCVGGQTLLSDTVTMYCTMGNEQYRDEGGNYGGSEVETTNNDGGEGEGGFLALLFTLLLTLDCNGNTSDSLPMKVFSVYANGLKS